MNLYNKYIIDSAWRSNDKLWCYEQINCAFNSELSSLFTCKISRLGNYQHHSYKHFSERTRNGKLLLWIRCLWRYCAESANGLYIIEWRIDLTFRWLKTKKNFFNCYHYKPINLHQLYFVCISSKYVIWLVWWVIQ